MPTLPRVLWIEDEAFAEYGEMWAPVFVSGYDLQLAGDATCAVRELASGPFEVVVVDIRIPPGDDPRWIKLYNDRRADPAAARLGLELLRQVLQPARQSGENRSGIPGKTGKDPLELLDALDANKIHEWLDPACVGVLSVEVGGWVQEDLDRLGIKHFKTKGPELPPTALLDLIRTIQDERSAP